MTKADHGQAVHAPAHDTAADSLVLKPTHMGSLPPARPGLEEELEEIRAATLTEGEMVVLALDRSIQALVKQDVALSNEVIRNDVRINQLQGEARQACFKALLTQQPVARDLREVLGFLHMASELERMGDHAVNVARVARDLADLPPVAAVAGIARLGRQATAQVRDILVALVAHDVDQARAIAARDDRVNSIFRRTVDELIRFISENPDHAYRGTKLIGVSQNLERVGDRVTNLAEDLVFLETGQTEELG
ncbi:MAG: phosphate signaling complex protein PhoU [Candidatus Dormibacteria bacterium]